MNLEKQPASIVEAFFRQVELSPEKILLRFEGQEYSYRQFQVAVSKFAGALKSWGLKPGDRLALFLDNCPEFLIAYLGTHLAGGVVVLVNSQYRQVELSHILSDAGVRFCLTDPAGLPEIERVKDHLPDLEKILTTGAAYEQFVTAGGEFSPEYPPADNLAVIAYTSGTTGRSKGAMLLHRNLISNIKAVRQAWHWTENDRLLLALPLFHTHGLMVGAHGVLTSGGSAELRRKFVASEVYDILQREPVTMFFGVPTMYTRLLQEVTAHSEKPRPLRLFVSGSAPLSPQTFAEFRQLFGQNILERYGMTETIMNMTNPYEGERRPGTVGLPFPGQEARVVHVSSREPLPPECDGEIEVRGPHVFKGYWNRPEATAESFSPDGWFRTGDLGQVSPDGYFSINGRAKELIISGGYNVYPREVEEVLQTCPGVKEVAVIGLPDPDLGEQVVAIVVPSNADLKAETLVAFCRDNLASYKKPRQVIFAETLPRNAMGKIQKHIIKETINS